MTLLILLFALYAVGVLGWVLEGYGLARLGATYPQGLNRFVWVSSLLWPISSVVSLVVYLRIRKSL